MESDVFLPSIRVNGREDFVLADFRCSFSRECGGEEFWNNIFVLLAATCCGGFAVRSVVQHTKQSLVKTQSAQYLIGVNLMALVALGSWPSPRGSALVTLRRFPIETQPDWWLMRFQLSTRRLDDSSASFCWPLHAWCEKRDADILARGSLSSTVNSIKFVPPSDTKRPCLQAKVKTVKRKVTWEQTTHTTVKIRK